MLKRTKRTAYERVQLAILEPSSVVWAMVGVYIVMLTIGTVTIFDHPLAVRLLLGGQASIVWALFFITGGAVGIPSALRGIWAFEQLAIHALGIGSALYLLTVILMGDVWPVVIVRVGFVIIAQLLLLARWLTVRQMDLSPGEPVIPRKNRHHTVR